MLRVSQGAAGDFWVHAVNVYVDGYTYKNNKKNVPYVMNIDVDLLLTY